MRGAGEQALSARWNVPAFLGHTVEGPIVTGSLLPDQLSSPDLRSRQRSLQIAADCGDLTEFSVTEIVTTAPSSARSGLGQNAVSLIFC